MPLFELKSYFEDCTISFHVIAKPNTSMVNTSNLIANLAWSGRPKIFFTKTRFPFLPQGLLIIPKPGTISFIRKSS